MAEFTIISEVHSTKATIRELYNFLIDFKNFERILPADKVENFTYTNDSCSFNVRGVTELNIKRFEQIPHESIKFQSEGAQKFSFVLAVRFEGNPDETGRCHVELIADTAPFIKILAEKPLGKLINTMAQRLAEMQVNKV